MWNKRATFIARLEMELLGAQAELARQPALENMSLSELNLTRSVLFLSLRQLQSLYLEVFERYGSDAGDAELADLLRRSREGVEALESLVGRIASEVQGRALRETDQYISACRHCHSERFYIGPKASIEVGFPSPNLSVRVIICAGCRDVRMQLSDPEELSRWASDSAVLEYVVPGRRGPYRSV